MIKYLISASHEPDQCLQALDAELAKGTDVLDRFVYGCREGDHTAYAVVDVANKSEALALVPDFLQDNACITRVDKFSPADIRSLHAKAA